ncbi:MAG: hypothetical protein RLN60_02365 [Phycisphaerales bacterium]
MWADEIESLDRFLDAGDRFAREPLAAVEADPDDLAAAHGEPVGLHPEFVRESVRSAEKCCHTSYKSSWCH